MRAAKGYPVRMLTVCLLVAAGAGIALADWVTATVAAGNGPYAVAVNPVTNKIYVANCASDNVTVIDGATNDTALVPAGSQPQAVAANPVTDKIYVANYASENVTVVDGATDDTTLVATGTNPYAVAVNPVTDKIYVANQTSNNVTVIDGATNATTTVDVRTHPCAVAVNPVTNKIYVANFNSDSVTVIDGATNGTTQVPAGSMAYAVVVNPVTNKIYVTTRNTVTVIDGATNATTTVTAGQEPNALAVNPVTNKVYIVNKGSNNVTVITDAPVNDTKVRVALDRLPGDTTSVGRPALTGKGVNRSSPGRTAMLGVGNRMNTNQMAWDWATVTFGAGTDSITWTYHWGTDSLIPGENFVCCVPLEDQAATANNLGLGSPFAGNMIVYPVYRMWSLGVQEPVASPSLSLSFGPTVLRGVLFLSEASSHKPQAASLLDAAGRKVLDLHPGENNVSGLAPGVYFIREVQNRVVRKVVVTR